MSPVPLSRSHASVLRTVGTPAPPREDGAPPPPPGCCPALRPSRCRTASGCGLPPGWFSAAPAGAVYASASLNRRLICPSNGSLVCSLDAPDCFFFNRRSCSISHRYCCAVSCRASPPFLGHWKLPLSSRLYTSTNPSPSQYSPLSRSFRRPQNRNCAFWNESR